MPPNATSTSIVPTPGTSSRASSWLTNDGTFVSSTLSTRPSRQAARTSTGPAGASRRSLVSGSRNSIIPVSSSTVATQIVFEPDIGGYSVGSMMMKPASQSARVAGTTRFACTATLPRGSRSNSRRRESSARSVCICSKTVLPGGGRTPPTTTLPISPPAWQPTTVIVRRERTRQSPRARRGAAAAGREAPRRRRTSRRRAARQAPARQVPRPSGRPRTTGR